MILAAKAATSGISLLPYQWVAYGASGALSTSTSATASSWTTRTSSFGTTPIFRVATDKTSIYVAVGGSGKLATSPDGVTWTQRTSSFGTSNINGVAYGNGIWVAVGADGKVATAGDPTGTWTQRTTGFAAGDNVLRIAYGNGIWVALTFGGAMRTATDPTGTWTSRTSTLTWGQFVRWCPSQNVFVAGADTSVTTGAFASSADGITWTARNSPNTTNSLVSAVVTANTSVIAISYNTTAPALDICTSTDGATWTDRTPALTVGPPAGAASDDVGLLAVSYTNAIQTSSDGVTWTSRTAPTITDMRISHSLENFG